MAFDFTLSEPSTKVSWTLPEIIIKNKESTPIFVIKESNETTSSSTHRPMITKSSTNHANVSTFTTVSEKPLQLPKIGEGKKLISNKDGPYFDTSMEKSHFAYLGKIATLTCIVHGAKKPNSVGSC